MLSNIFSNKLITDKSTPFCFDYTGKLKYLSETLTNILVTEAEKHPITISIDAPWGVGKTTFIDMWGQSLINQKIWAIKFDAWKNDHSDSPLLSIITELFIQLEYFTKSRKLKTLITTSKNLLLKLIPKISKHSLLYLLKHAKISNEDIKKFLEEFNDLNENELNKLIEEHREKTTTLQKFRQALEKVVNNRKLFIFIDELDRCKPPFSIAILEIIKHIFEVKNVCFIISINKSAISKSIGNVYGYDENEASEYLDRFIDIPFILPEPDAIKFICNKLHDLDTLNNKNRALFFDAIKTYCKSSKMSLRIMEKSFRDIQLFLLYNKTIPEKKQIPSIYYSCILINLISKRINKSRLNFVCEEMRTISCYSIINSFFKSSSDIDKLNSEASGLLKRIDSYQSRSHLTSSEADEKRRLEFVWDEVVVGLYGGHKILDNQCKLENYINHFSLAEEITSFLVSTQDI